MKVVILYRPNTEHDTPVQDYIREYHRRTGHEIDLISLDTTEGAEIAKLYDAVEYPAFIAKSEDGHLQHMWQGEPFPLIDELNYYNTGNV